ncbi:hypothetical protein [Nocardia donostiensis]|uniref:Serine hydrolase n=1 Tax=Nocardia donostiensis TaxID=1538463 RepID=A0A1V2TAD7_9NOCA|nr:hypothetical protein [Nocardia donostiensis]ONM46459.1 hypothetical protein B0T46_22775 [Nocardia donostiensis]OQS14247.1 hypothetical protein B0T36_14620 [Nocardia donostiensis]OQS18139.1 hypothetical protein B0T44_21355 [Nocardia donostiensis]
MSYRALAIAALAASACWALTPPAVSAAPSPEPAPPSATSDTTPPRTAISVRTPFGFQWGTANEFQTRSALSMAKLYLADYALRHGDGSAEDHAYGERMIRYSDDAAADAVEAKYPGAIAAVAAEYGLEETRPGTSWSTSTTSTADLADFLDTKQRTDPGSPILGWMATAAPTAADGTEQNWGTALLPGVQGTKWGWSDMAPPEVASASFGPGFSVAAHTHGSPADQNNDLFGAVPTVIADLLGVPVAPSS